MADKHTAPCSRWRLKNKTLSLGAKRAAASAEKTFCGSKVIEDILCSGFGCVTLGALMPHELATLELSCCSLRGTLSRKSASSLWSASAHAYFRRRRLMLPVEELTSMTLIQIKSMVASMEFASGPLNGGLVPVSGGSEFAIVSSICRSSRGSNIRFVTSRLHFTPRYLDCDSDIEYDDDDDDIEAQEEESILFSDEMRFVVPGSNSKSEMLKASLGCVPGIMLLEVSNVIQTFGSALALDIDVHLVSPLWPHGLKAEGLKVRVDGSCVAFKIPGFDVANKEVRESLLATDGVLCVFGIRSFPNVVAVD